MTTATPIRMAHETTDRPAVFLAFAWGANPGQLGCTTGAAQRPRERRVPARHLEAGRDGFWRHRGCVPQGVEHVGVDSSSLAVHRRHRRATPDRLAGPPRRGVGASCAAGARQVWRRVRVPRLEAEDRRQRHRA